MKGEGRFKGGQAVLWSGKQIPCPWPFEVSVSAWLGVECNVPSPSPLLEPQESLAPDSQSVVAAAQARPPQLSPPQLPLRLLSSHT